MKTETSFIKRGATVLLSGALAMAFSPAVFAPAALADTGTSSSDSLETVSTAAGKIQNALEQNDVAKNSQDVVELYDFIVSQKGQDALTEDQLVYIASCLSYQLDAADKKSTSLQKQLSQAQKELEEAQSALDSAEASTLKKKTKISKLSATAPTMGKVVVSWKVTNSIDGLSYQIRYRPGSGKWTSVKTKKLAKTFKKLKAGKTYSFKVRAYKKLSGKTVYGTWSKTASAKAIPVYKKGSYKVTGDWLNVHEKTKTTSDNSDVLISVPRGTQVSISKVKLVKGVVWGKLSYRGQTGWVQMQYLKAA